jgi:hypothetical protein
MLDRVTKGQYNAVMKMYWQQHNEDGLRLRSDSLLYYSLCCRGDNLRGLHLSEVGHDHYETEGHSGTDLLRTVWDK